MILLEVSRMFTDHGRLLGEHRWSETLTSANELEEFSATQVFHSFYTTGRDAQKDGWKAIPIPNVWFKGWVPGNGYVVLCRSFFRGANYDAYICCRIANSCAHTRLRTGVRSQSRTGRTSRYADPFRRN